MTFLLYTAGVVVFLLAVMISIGLHELGHLYFAKKYGCLVTEYMIGFGPKLFAWKKGETSYGLKLVPLGGYVRIVGMFPPEEALARGAKPADVEAGPDEGSSTVRLRKSNTGMFAQMISETRASQREEIDKENEGRLFYKLPWHKKAMTMFAGPLVNLVLAFLCLQAVYGVYGTHSIEPTGSTEVATVSECVISVDDNREVCTGVDETTTAADLGLEAGDEITAFNDEPITDWASLQPLIREHGGEQITLDVVRDGETLTLGPVELKTADRVGEDGETTTVGYLGVGPVTEEIVEHHGPVFVLGQMADLTTSAINSIVTLPARVWNVAEAIVGQAERDPDGVVSIVGGSRLAGEVAAADEVKTGLGVAEKAAMLGLLAGGFNLFIGLFNLVPLLPLDGGHIVGALYEQMRRVIGKWRGRAYNGYADIAKLMPVAYIIGAAMLVMGSILILGDFVVPLTLGL